MLVLLVGAVTARAAGGRAGVLSAAVLASCVGWQVLARAAHPEMALDLGTGTAEVVLAAWIASGPRAWSARTAAAVGAAMGFGFLAKGPNVLLFAAGMALAARAVVPRASRPPGRAVAATVAVAAAVGLALAAPWFVWMGARHGTEFWKTVFLQLRHATSTEKEHFPNSPVYFVPVLAAGVLAVPAALPGLADFDARWRPWRQFGAEIAAHAAPGDPVVVYRRRVPSLEMYAGRVTEPAAEPDDVAAAVARPGRAWIVVRTRHLPQIGGGAPYDTVLRAADSVLLRER